MSDQEKFEQGCDSYNVEIAKRLGWRVVLKDGIWICFAGDRNLTYHSRVDEYDAWVYFATYMIGADWSRDLNAAFSLAGDEFLSIYWIDTYPDWVEMYPTNRTWVAYVGNTSLASSTPARAICKAWIAWQDEKEAA